jgi:hypothetical protein
MNQFFYESNGKEKVRDLMNEGMMSQAYERSGAGKRSFLHRIPKLIMGSLILLAFAELLIH